MQHFAIFCSQKSAKRWEPTKIRQGPRLNGEGSGKFKPPVSTYHLHTWVEREIKWKTTHVMHDPELIKL